MKRMMLSDKLCLGSVPETIGYGYDQLTDDTLTKRSNDSQLGEDLIGSSSNTTDGTKAGYP